MTVFTSLWIIWGLISLQCAWNVWRTRPRPNEYRRHLYDDDPTNPTNER